jgi:ABC-type antimicrobial peptide transport system permease subunit
MVLTRAVVFLAMGLAIGLSAGWTVARLVQAFLFQVEAHAPIVYVSTAGALTIAGRVAALVPAMRASRVDPVTALR